jgi:hypothetical protein
MGMDREALDIWKFGRARPDLSFEEVRDAPDPQITAQQARQRDRLLSHRKRALMKELLGQAPSILARARSAKP